MQRREPLQPPSRGIPPPVDTNEGPVMSNYRQFLEGGAPNREDFKPSKMDRFGAALSGVSAGAQGKGGYEAARGQLDRPYNMAMEDYASKAGLLEKGASVESERFNRERLERADEDRRLNYESLDRNRQSLAASRERARTLAEVIQSGKATDEQKQAWELEKINLRGDVEGENIITRGEQAVNLEGVRQSGRMALQKFRQENPNFRIVASRGGNYIAINPSDPNDVIDTGVNTGSLTEADRIEFTRPTGTSSTSTTSLADDGKSITTDRRTTPNPPPSRPAPKPQTTASGNVVLKDKNGVEWEVEPGDVEAFKKENNIR